MAMVVRAAALIHEAGREPIRQPSVLIADGRFQRIAAGAAITYNIKKLVDWHGRRPQSTALALGPDAPPAAADRTTHVGPRHHVCHQCQPFSRN